MSTTQTSPPATGQTVPRSSSRVGDHAPGGGQSTTGTQRAHTTPRPNTSPPATSTPVPMDGSRVGTSTPGGGQSMDDAQRKAATPRSINLSAVLAEIDPNAVLAVLADALDDIERTRIANENRLRAMTRSQEDSDGEVRGLGLTERHPQVAQLSGIVAALVTIEDQTTKALSKHLRNSHPLGPWVKAARGVGEKQGARLLASIGNPYMRGATEHEDGTVTPARPRTVSELWAYCGYHTLPSLDENGSRSVVPTLPVSDHTLSDTQGRPIADGNQAGQRNAVPQRETFRLPAGNPSHMFVDTQLQDTRVAAKRAKGQRANWSATAKMRAYLVAESCMKQPPGTPYRDVYDVRKAATGGRTHGAPCVRCGPKGKPAQVGSAWSAGHRHADALRIVAKTILRDLWREGRRLAGD